MSCVSAKNQRRRKGRRFPLSFPLPSLIHFALPCLSRAPFPAFKAFRPLRSDPPAAFTSFASVSQPEPPPPPLAHSLQLGRVLGAAGSSTRSWPTLGPSPRPMRTCLSLRFAPPWGTTTQTLPGGWWPASTSLAPPPPPPSGSPSPSMGLGAQGSRQQLRWPRPWWFSRVSYTQRVLPGNPMPSRLQ